MCLLKCTCGWRGYSDELVKQVIPTGDGGVDTYRYCPSCFCQLRDDED